MEEDEDDVVGEVDELDELAELATAVGNCGPDGGSEEADEAEDEDSHEWSMSPAALLLGKRFGSRRGRGKWRPGGSTSKSMLRVLVIGMLSSMSFLYEASRFPCGTANVWSEAFSNAMK